MSYGLFRPNNLLGLCLYYSHLLPHCVLYTKFSQCCVSPLNIYLRFPMNSYESFLYRECFCVPIPFAYCLIVLSDLFFS